MAFDPKGYKVYLYDILGALNQTQIIQINLTLQGYFEQVAKAAKQSGAMVHWAAYYPNGIQDHELIIYFMPWGNSVAKATTNNYVPQLKGKHDGFTSIGAKTCSEVYVNFADPVVLANLAFHEAMHNKLQLGNGMHTGADGMRQATVSPTTPLSPANIKDMAGALMKKVPQYTDGVQRLVQRRIARDQGDPLWYLPIEAL